MDNELPRKYGIDHVAAIPQSPTSLFVYWELSGQRSEYYQKKDTGEVEWRLSLINLDEDGDISWISEVKIDPEVGNHYLRVQPGNRYRVELGVKVGEVFHPICHTRERVIPRDEPASSKEISPGHTGDYARGQFQTEEKPKEDIPPGLKWQKNILDGMGSS